MPPREDAMVMTVIPSSGWGHLLLAVLGMLVLAALFAGCVGERQAAAAAQTISVVGSTTVLPVAQLAADEFMNTHPYADIQVSGGGSSVGIRAVGERTADIGMASRGLRDAEKARYPDLVDHPIAVDAIAIIVHPDNPVGSLTLDQLRAIYNGSITSWRDAGGTDQQIVVVGRDSASGTRETFSEVVMEKESFAPAQLEKNSNGAVKQTVARTPGAIGYVGLGYLDDTVKAVPIDPGGAPVAPTIENVRNARYPISRSLHMFTRGEPEGLAEEYIGFLLGDEGQRIVEEEGFVGIA
ncbi:MAG: phosphate ABC transporter substrate-binding protein [Methanomicrobiaceae archaeon]|nr:phosphate ABC transporter substrate-binding protein [Methanomicrobiaceae archaeon]